MDAYLEIEGRKIGRGHPTYVIAEISANHNGSIADAVRLIDAAADAGADAVKLQTYTPDTITLDCDNEYFRIKGTLWEGKTLHGLYGEAMTPWEWHAELAAKARSVGLQWFSSPFDDTAVDFLVGLGAPAFKVASFECVDIGLLRTVAKTGKPIIVSTGMASLAEIDEAVSTLRAAGARQIALLKCTSAYPAPADDMNLRAIPHLAEAFEVVAGLSDHTLGGTVPVAAIALGAAIVEKHITLSRATPGPDSAFSLEPHEFKEMVAAIRVVEKALGKVHYGVSAKEAESRVFRRSLFVVRDVKKGESFTSENVRSIRPAHGLHTRHLPEVLGRQATRDIARGTPLAWELVGS
jgi:pseudaminic acid synthase